MLCTVQPKPIPVDEIPVSIDPLINLSDYKKDLKRILNKRALAIASQLNGDFQDEALRDHEQHLSKVEQELSYYRNVKSKGIKENISISEVLEHAVKSQDLDDTIYRLDLMRTELKDKVKSILILFALY